MANDFLGSGLTRPFQRNGKGDFSSATDRKLIDKIIGQVLGTRAAGPSTQGEIPWRPNAGSKIYLVRHRNNSIVAQETARTFVIEALRRWEPRVEVIRVELIEAQTVDDLNKMALRIVWQPIDRNVDENRVRFGPFTTEVQL